MTEHVKDWAFSPYPITTGTPPTRMQSVDSWGDLPKAIGERVFKVTSPDGSAHTVALRAHTQQVLRGLMDRPLQCASKARLSEYVSQLKNEHRVEIHTERYHSKAFGVYFLVSEVVMLDGGAV